MIITMCVCVGGWHGPQCVYVWVDGMDLSVCMCGWMAYKNGLFLLTGDLYL